MSVVCCTLLDLRSDRNLLHRYLDPHGYLRHCDPAWLRMVESNPYARDEDLVLVLVVSGDTVVGRLGLHPGMACYLAQSERTYWMDGFYLQPDYKNTGAGGRMLLTARSFSPSLLACGAPSEDLQKVYRTIGFYELGPLQRYVYFYNADVIAKKLLHTERLPAALSPLATAGSWLLRGFYKSRARSQPPRLRFTPVTTFKPSLDELLGKAGLNFFPRDHRTLNWVLEHQKNVFPFETWLDEKQLGYCLLKRRLQPAVPARHLPEMTVGCLLDYWWGAEAQADKYDLVEFCIDFFKNQAVDVLEVQVCDPELGRTCAELGMAALGGNRIFFRPASQAQPLPASGWFLTHGTADVLLTGR